MWLRRRVLGLAAAAAARTAGRPLRPRRPLPRAGRGAASSSAGLAAARRLSSASEERRKPERPKLPSLKQQLKHVFLRVHPDLLQADHPEEAKTNTKSLGLLNSMMDGLADGSAHGSYNLKFYLRGGDGDKEALRLVKSSVRIGGSGPIGKRRALHSNLRDLFKGIGLAEDNFIWGDAFGASSDHAAASADATPADFAQFLRDSHATISELLAERRDVEQRLFAVQAQIRLSRVRLLLRHDEDLTAEERLELLERVSSAVAVPEHGALVRSTVLVVDAGFASPHVDALGRLVLGADDDADAWRAFLGDPATAHAVEHRHRAWKVTSALEKEAAEAAGLYHVFCEPVLVSEPDYLAFLGRLAGGADELAGALGRRPELARLSLRVHGPERQPPFYVHPTMGFLGVPVTCDVPRLAFFLESRGAEASHIAEGRQRRDSEYNELTLRTKRYLRLASLTRAAGVVDQEQMQKCCRRLLNSPPKVVAMLDGMDVVVGDAFGYDQGGRLHVRHDM